MHALEISVSCRRRSVRFFPLMALFGGVCAAAEVVAPLERMIAPGDPRLHYGGRWDFRDGDGPRAAWPGSAVTARFRGTRIGVFLRESNANRHEVFVDGARAATLVPGKGARWHCLAEGLAEGEHTVMLVKRTESFFGVMQVLGWRLDEDAVLLPAARPSRALEFVGDSITCGYGNEAPDQTCKFSAETENAAAAYGFLAALDLDAEYTAVAWSGKCLWPRNSILDLYDRVLPQDATSVLDFAAVRHPDAVLINLGTNDFAGGVPEEEGWVGAYVAFVKRLRALHPQARIYCAVGPMMNDQWPAGAKALSTVRGYLRRVVAESGDGNIAFLEFPAQDGSAGFGADWHPSVRTHRRMADHLIATLRADLGW
jgi:lysophospholipase L1-like esterase